MPANPTRVAAAALIAAVALLSGCSEEDAEHSPTPGPVDTPTADTEAVVHTYTVRGQVVTIPSDARPLDELQIRHEAIPNYADREGNVYVNSQGQKGMGAMTMGFPLAEGVSLEGIEPGDPVEFTFVVTWGESYPLYEVTEIRELPADTVLDFSRPSSGG